MERQLTIWVRHARVAIAAAEQRAAEQRQGEERRLPTPDWIVELGIGQVTDPAHDQPGRDRGGTGPGCRAGSPSALRPEENASRVEERWSRQRATTT
jgi:hypothetical protein